MKAKGNGTVQQCVHNLLKIVRGEVPFDRIRGIDPRIIDQPATSAAAEAQNDADWVISAYEPRAANAGVSVAVSEGENGDFELLATIEKAQEVSTT